MKLKRAKWQHCGGLQSVETNDKLCMAEPLFFVWIFFQFSDSTETSVNTVIFGQFPEVRVYEVLLYMVAYRYFDCLLLD